MFTAVKLRNYKTHKTLDIQLNPEETLITGPNGIGKTSIGEAVVWCLTGKDFHGSATHKNLISIGQNKMLVSVSTPSWTVERSVTQKSSPTIKVTVAGWDAPAVMGQSELEEKLGVNFEIFTTIFKIGWFLDQDPKKRRDIVRSFVGDSDIAEIIKKLMKMDELPSVKGVNYQDHKKDLKAVCAIRLEAEREIGEMMAAKSEQEAVLSGFEGGSINIDESMQKHTNIQNEIRAIRDFKERMKDYQRDLETHKDASQRFEEAQNRRNQILKEVEVFKAVQGPSEGELAKLQELKDSGPVDDRKPLLSKPSFTELPEDNCYTCGQKVTEKTKVAFKKQKEAALANWEQKNAEITQSNLKYDNAFSEWQKEVKALESYIQGKRDAKSKAENDIEFLRREYQSLSSVKEPQQAMEPTTKLDVTKLDELESAERELSGAISTYNAFEEKVKKSKSRISELGEFITKAEGRLKFYKRLEEAFKEVPSIQMRRIAKAIGVEGFDLDLIEKGGEVYGIDYHNKNGVPSAYMSTGERMKLSCSVSQALSNFFSKADGSPRIPLFFVDNHELMDETQTMRRLVGQRIVTRVSSEDPQIHIV